MQATFDEAIDAVLNEREYQDLLWGPTGSEGQHSILEFLVYIQSYTNEAIENASRHADSAIQDELLDSLRKITSLGVAAMEQNGVTYRDLSDLKNKCSLHGVCDKDDEPEFVRSCDHEQV